MERVTLIGQDKTEQQFRMQQLKSRTRSHYKCYECTEKGRQSLLYRLLGPAAPFISLIELFYLFALPTENTVTRQLVQFIIRSWQAYQRYQCSADTFRLEFYCSNVEGSPKTKGNSQIDNIINSVIGKKPEQLQAYAAAVRNDVKYQGILSEKRLAIFRKKEEEFLNKLAIIPQNQKIKQLNRLPKTYIQKETANVFIQKQRVAGKKQRQVMSLQEIMFGCLDSVTIVSSQQQIEDLYIDISSKMNALQEQSKQLADFDLDLSSILVDVTCISAKQHKYALLENSCEIDYMQPFMQAVGLQFHPITLHQLLLNPTPKPPLLRSSSAFNEVLKDQYHIDANHLPHINTTLTWILIIDCLFTKILCKNRLALIERKVSKKEIIQCLLSNREQQHMHPHARTLVNLLKSKLPKEFLANLSLKAICDLFEVGRVEEDNLYEQKKYSNIKHSLQLKVRLITEGENLKYFWERSKLIVSYKAMGRLVCLYLLAKYALLETEAQFLQLWQGEKLSKLLDPKYDVVQHISKLSHLCEKIEEKIEKMKTTKRAEEQELALQLRLFEQLKQYNCFDKQNANATSQLKDSTKTMLAQMFGKVREDVEKASEPISYFSARRNACLFRILMDLTLTNYSFLFCEYQSLANTQPKLKTVVQMRDFFGELQQRMEGMALKATEYFFKE